MLKQASWTHGNSVVVEQPENLSSIHRFGWGTDLLFIPGRASWCHIPIPTPVKSIKDEDENTNASPNAVMPSQPSPMVFIKCAHCKFENIHQEVIDHHVRLSHNENMETR